MDEFLNTTSNRPVRDTMDCLEAHAKARGLTVFARIDHALGAATAGLKLAPMRLLIVGSPRAGTPLIQASHMIGLDLPILLLVWEYDQNRVLIRAVT